MDKTSRLKSRALKGVPKIIYCPNCGQENKGRIFCSLCRYIFPAFGSDEWKRLGKKPKGHSLHELVSQK